MTIEQTIKKAIQGGWKPKGFVKYLHSYPISQKVAAVVKVKYKERFFLDSNFWKSLEKAFYIECGEHTKRGYCVNCDGKGYHSTQPWRIMWHEFIDHLAEGKAIEDFFKLYE